MLVAHGLHTTFNNTTYVMFLVIRLGLYDYKGKSSLLVMLNYHIIVYVAN